jgi:branched-chain amino acid transport system substrate-binding protein
MKTNWKIPRCGAMMKLSALVLLLASCGQPAVEEKTEPAQEPIKVGVILPLTGRLAVMGEVERNAMMLAARDLNSLGERVKLQFEDGMGTAKDAVAAANKLLDIDQVDVLITSTTGASLAVQPIAIEKKRNLVAFCMDPDVAGASDYTTRLYAGIEEEAKAITDHFGSLKAPVKVAILHAKVPAFEKVVNSTYLPALKAAGHEVEYVESYEVAQTDFRSLVLKLKGSRATHLILLGYGFEYPNIFKELKADALTGKLTILGGWGFLYTPLDKRLLEGTLVSGPEYVFSKKDAAGAFYKSYTQTYGSAPNFDAAFAYGVIGILAEHMTKTEASKPLKQKLVQEKQLSGVAGTFSIDARGNMIVKTALGVYRNGVLEPYTAQ